MSTRNQHGLENYAARLRFRVLSPDGVPIEPRTYPTEGRALLALAAWCLRFEAQGFYSAADGQRIALSDLPARCTVETTR